MSLQFIKNKGLKTSHSLALAVLAINMTFNSPISGQTIELSELVTVQSGFQINGIDTFDLSGTSVSGAGDVNGDGLADLIIGARWADPNGTQSGESYVVFGKTNSTPVELSALGSEGFQINGIDDYDNSGTSTSGAGDVNGDGLADLIIGAPDAYQNPMRASGESYVVFGKTDSNLVELNTLDTDGFKINGINSGDLTGSSVSGAGDVNGDGLPDLIVGASDANNSGESYVVFGKVNTTTVELRALGSGGFRISGVNSGDYSGFSVSGAGDINGDGLADLIVGAPQNNFYTPGTGESYVVFGKSNNTTVDLGNLGTVGNTEGFQIDGIDINDISGGSVSSAGDVNGDGLSDLIIGAPQADPNGINSAGESYVIFGKTDSTTVELSALGTGGFQINGINAGDLSGYSVSGAGDVNGDGLADLIVAAPRADPNGIVGAGECYIVFGKTNSNTVELSNLGAEGIQISGIDENDRFGYSVSSAGDVNGDGLADVIVGAPRADSNGLSANGESYVIFSPVKPPTSATYLATALGGNAPRVAIGISGDGSNYSSPDSRTFIDFADGGLATSLQTVTLTRNNSSIANLDDTANVLWEVSTNRSNWTSANIVFKYTNKEIANLKEPTLKLFQATSPSGPWTELTGATLTAARNQISADVSTLGYFAIQGTLSITDEWIILGE